MYISRKCLCVMQWIMIKKVGAAEMDKTIFHVHGYSGPMSRKSTN